MDLHPDFRDLLVEFERYAVKYAILGGYAIGYHAQPRATKDLDLLLSGLDDNQDKVALALAALGAPAIVIESVRRQTNDEIVYFGAPPVRVDCCALLMASKRNQRSRRAESVRVGELTVQVLGIDDLILNKLAAGRPQDIADVALLRRVRGKKGT